MAKLNQHRIDGTYYLQTFEGGIVTRQIHPDGVRWLKSNNYDLGDDITGYPLSVLRERKWLFTKEESQTWGEVDWSPDWNSIGASSQSYQQTWLQEQKAAKRELKRQEEEAVIKRDADNKRRRERAALRRQELVASQARDRQLELDRQDEEERRKSESGNRQIETNQRRRERYRLRKLNEVTASNSEDPIALGPTHGADYLWTTAVVETKPTTLPHDAHLFPPKGPHEVLGEQVVDILNPHNSITVGLTRSQNQAKWVFTKRRATFLPLMVLPVLLIIGLLVWFIWS
jgi:hypothetical protein